MRDSDREEEAFEEKRRPRPASPREEDMIEGRPRRPRARDDEDMDERPRRSRSREYDDDDDIDDRPRRRRQRQDDDRGPYATFIPYRNVMALVAYYCSMFALIAILGGLALLMGGGVGGFLTPALGNIAFAVIYALGGLLSLLGSIFGILGITYARKSPKARGMGHAITGLVLGILEILGLLAILLIHLAVRSR
jgi:hypothetical protein